MDDKTLPLPPLLVLAGMFSRLIPERVRSASRRLPGLSQATGALLDRAAPAGPVDVRVVRGPLRGAWLRLSLRSEREYWLGFYERRLIAAIGDFCRPGMAVYDLGANIGYTALLCARAARPGGVVYAFEPLEENLRRMRAHLARNGAAGQVEVVAAAVSDCEGRETFLIHESSAMGKLVGSGGRETDYAGRLEVPGLRLDDFVYRDGRRPPDLIKLDIEGGGVRAFPGMARALAEARPTLLMELHGPAEKQAALAALRPLGYRLLHMLPGYPALKDERELHIQWRQHVIAVPGDSMIRDP